MIKIEKYGQFLTGGISKKKNKIILLHSSREIKEYLTSLKYRNNSKFYRIPNYIVTKEGKILQLLDNNKYCNLTYKNDINKQSIFICLENLGWLQKEPLKEGHINWIGNIYKEKVLQRKWREHYLWQPYTESQLENTATLCGQLFDEMNIKKDFVGHNTKVNGIEKFEGILNRSNLHEDYTDLSPAFDFELFSEKLKL
jgi:N-acetyl-anhydromuramyl-L-alanine amidase AmpD